MLAVARLDTLTGGNKRRSFSMGSWGDPSVSPQLTLADRSHETERGLVIKVETIADKYEGFMAVMTTKPFVRETNEGVISILGGIPYFKREGRVRPVEIKSGYRIGLPRRNCKGEEYNQFYDVIN